VKQPAEFSVVITSYNQREFIKDAVDSALALSRRPREIVVVDDGSTDGSHEMLKEYGDRIHFLPLQKNLGRCGARNAGAAQTTGDYLLFLDGDDALLPWALDICGQIADARQPKLILCPMQWFKGALPPVSSVEPPSSIRLVEYADYYRRDRAFELSASSVVIERQAFESVQGWSHYDVMEDQELLIRLGTCGPTAHILSPPTTFHRSHAGQTVKHVPPFITTLSDMIRQERVGRYPGGASRRLDRADILGKLVLYWVKRALKAGLYTDAMKLLLMNIPVAVVALSRRCSIALRGRLPDETLGI